MALLRPQVRPGTCRAYGPRSWPRRFWHRPEVNALDRPKQRDFLRLPFDVLVGGGRAKARQSEIVGTGDAGLIRATAYRASPVENSHSSSSCRISAVLGGACAAPVRITKPAA